MSTTHTSTYITLPGTGTEVGHRLQTALTDAQPDIELVLRDHRCVIEEVPRRQEPGDERRGTVVWAGEHDVQSTELAEKLWEVPRCEVVLRGFAKSGAGAAEAAAAIITGRILELIDVASGEGAERLKIVVWDDARLYSNNTAVFEFGAVAY